MQSVEAEGEWLASLGKEPKVTFLAALSYALTVSARTSYTVQGEGLDNPVQLRQVNEIQHRVLACLLQAINEESNTSFERSIASWVLGHTDTEMKKLGLWVWGRAKEAIS